MGVSLQQHPLALFLIFVCFLFLPSFSEPIQKITSCLTRHNINNFTTFPNTPNDSAAYYKILNFSIQNLRFAEPTCPKPLVIILPETVEQIRNAFLCSRKSSLKIIARCGGHSYEGTTSVANEGSTFVIIDMMNLNRISVDLESETAWVEGGATLGETYYAIANASNVHGFSAGSCPTVGVGGHISGGGFGLLSRKYGLAADNVVDALLLDAEGRLLDRRDMGEDVFWAIRGGGGGVWGIVCAWRIKLLKVPENVTGFIVSRPGTKSHVAELVTKWQQVAPYLGGDFYFSCFVGAGLPESKTTGISATFKGFYLGTKRNAMSILNQVFPELGAEEEDYKEMNWIESILLFAGLGNGSVVSDLRNRYLEDKKYFKAKSDYVRTQISFVGIRAALDILEEEPKGYVILDPYGGIMNEISSESIAFPHRNGNLFAIQYLVEWKEEDNDKREKYIDWIRRFYNSMTSFVSFGPRAAYVNYMDFDLGVMELLNTSVPSIDPVEIARVWGQKYFLNNYEKLVSAKTHIDPRNVFNNQQGIPPNSSLVGLHAER